MPKGLISRYCWGGKGKIKKWDSSAIAPFFGKLVRAMLAEIFKVKPPRVSNVTFSWGIVNVDFQAAVAKEEGVFSKLISPEGLLDSQDGFFCLMPNTSNQELPR